MGVNPYYNKLCKHFCIAHNFSRHAVYRKNLNITKNFCQQTTKSLFIKLFRKSFAKPKPISEVCSEILLSFSCKKGIESAVKSIFGGKTFSPKIVQRHGRELFQVFFISKRAKLTGNRSSRSSNIL